MSFLRKQLHLSVGIVERSPVLRSVEAAADEARGGRWFSANISVGNVISIATFVVALLSGWVTLQSSLAHMQATEAAQAQALEQIRENQQRIIQRFNAEVVSRAEYAENNQKIGDRFSAVQAQQLQIYGTLLADKR